jgi:FkbM family methyltransferase
MNIVKKLIQNTTGYWLHKVKDLPVGADLFVDIRRKINHPSLDILFDVGANTGQTKDWFRFHLPNAKIYSFEPVRSTFQQLQQHVAGDARCVAENLALGAEQGQQKIRLFEANMALLNSLNDQAMNNSGVAKEETVCVDTVDHYCQTHQIPKIDLLKIDTEGYELKVLKGAKHMMQQAAISLIYCETGFQSFNQRNTYFPTLAEFLAEKNYLFFGIYQMDYHDWKRGNHLGNALFVHKTAFKRQLQ